MHAILSHDQPSGVFEMTSFGFDSGLWQVAETAVRSGRHALERCKTITTSARLMEEEAEEAEEAEAA